MRYPDHLEDQDSANFREFQACGVTVLDPHVVVVIDRSAGEGGPLRRAVRKR